MQLFEARLCVNLDFGRRYASGNRGTSVLIKLDLLAILCVSSGDFMVFLTVIIGLTGVVSAEVLASGITWSVLLRRLQPPPLTPSPTAGPHILFNWPMFGFSLQHTRFNPDENVLNSTNVILLTVQWTAATGASISSSPSIVNSVVYVGSDDGKLV